MKNFLESSTEQLYCLDEVGKGDDIFPKCSKRESSQEASSFWRFWNVNIVTVTHHSVPREIRTKVYATRHAF